jgi:hypothetical protein
VPPHAIRPRMTPPQHPDAPCPGTTRTAWSKAPNLKARIHKPPGHRAPGRMSRTTSRASRNDGTTDHWRQQGHQTHQHVGDGARAPLTCTSQPLRGAARVPT